MGTSEYLLNSALLAAKAFRHRQFVRALDNIEAVQTRRLTGYLHKNRNTAFGREHGFAGIDSVEKYRASVPLSDYTDFEPWINAIRSGRAGVLTEEPVLRLVPTSGSTRRGKLIPYTRGLMREFDAGIAPWLVNFYRHYPRLRGCRAYWSITPHHSAVSQDGSVPETFGDDSEYLGGWLQHLAGSTFAVPQIVAGLSDFDQYIYTVALGLLRTENLGLISIWHPSYLELLAETLEANWQPLLHDVANGGVTGIDDPDVRRAFRHPLRYRAERLADASVQDWQSLWNSLSVISCWGDAHAAEAMSAMKQRHPSIDVIEKGLLSTECFVSFPFRAAGCGGHARWVRPLSLNSHFFEFLDCSGCCRLAGELESGSSYEVVVTTGGGLYRYRTGDLVRVDGWLQSTPCIEFVGKLDSISDRFGEKLDDAFVTGILEKVLKPHQRVIRFSLLAPDIVDGRTAYTLYLQLDENAGAVQGLAAELELALCSGFHYALCRKLGQLDHCRIFRISGDAQQMFLHQQRQAGIRLGDIKPLRLSPESVWSEVFSGRYQ